MNILRKTLVGISAYIISGTLISIPISLREYTIAKCNKDDFIFA